MPHLCYQTTLVISEVISRADVATFGIVRELPIAELVSGPLLCVELV